MGSTIMEDQKTVDLKEETYKAITELETKSLKHKSLRLQNLNDERYTMKEKEDSEYLDLKKGYDVKYSVLCQEIQDIVSGANSLPTLTEQEYEKYGIVKPTESSEKGIENYWLNVMKNSNDFFIINSKDEQILKHLSEVKVNEKEDKLSFAIEFYFTPNEFFTNEMLTKEYNYDAQEQKLTKVTQSEIQWKSESVNLSLLPRLKKRRIKPRLLL